MKTRIASENVKAEELLPPNKPDGSGVGVNYIDAYIKRFNVELDDGRQISCRRKGLKIIFTIDEKKGEALLRRMEHGPDPRDMLHHALTSAVRDAGATLSVEEGEIYLDL